MESAAPPEPAPRRRLLDATLAVVAERGLPAVTHRAVAEAAGVPLGLTTYYFRSKDDLIESALTQAADEEIAQLRERAEALDEGLREPAVWTEALTDWLAEQLHPAARGRLIAQYQLQLRAAHRPELRRVCARWNDANRELAERALAAAGALDPARDARLLIAAVDGLRLLELSTTPSGLHRDEIRGLLDRLLGALTAPAR